MPRVSALSRNGDQVVAFFEAQGPAVYQYAELGLALGRHRSEWGLPASQSLGRLIEFLKGTGRLRHIELKSPYGQLDRYFWGEPSVFSVALSLRDNAYLSHGTAVFLHGLTEQVPKVIYLNREQSPKPRRDKAGALSQPAIDRAFSRPQRRSKMAYRFAEYEIVVLNGMATQNLEVISMAGPNGEVLKVTSIERTLVDIAVRPSYAGGVVEVLEAYRRAQGRCSVAKLTATLRKLGYVYPYHQAIGYYLERAGYSTESLERLRAMGLNFDFYLSYGLKAPHYDERWRLHLPEGL